MVLRAAAALVRTWKEGWSPLPEAPMLTVYSILAPYDQLWLINDANDVCDVVINLLLKDGNGDIIEDEIDYHLYDGSDAPYKGFLYTIEYKKSNIIEKLLSQLVNDTRKLYVEYNASGKFEQVKRN